MTPLPDIRAYIKKIRQAPLIPKRELIRSMVKGKSVLDLGFIGHTLDHCLKDPNQWLHNIIRQNAQRVLGVDRLASEVQELQKLGYEAIAADALTLRLETKFDVVVCGDLLEHVQNPQALLETISFHLRDEGYGIITTPNPFAVNRFFNILADGWTAINTEHVAWYCPQTLLQLLERSQLILSDFYWIETDYPMLTRRRWLGPFLNALGQWLSNRNRLLSNDYGVIVSKSSAQVIQC